MRDGRDENLIPSPQSLRTKPQIPPTPHRETSQPFFFQSAPPHDLSLQLLPSQLPATRKNTQRYVLHRDVQPVPRVCTTPQRPTTHPPNLIPHPLEPITPYLFVSNIILRRKFTP